RDFSTLCHAAPSSIPFPYTTLFRSALLLVFSGSGAFAGAARQDDVPDIVESFPVGAAPRGLAFDGANIWVTSDTTTNLTKLRASDGTLLGSFPAGGKTAFAVFDGTYVWVTNPYDDTVSRLRASDGTLQGTFT